MQTNLTFAVADCCSAFQPETIGTKVTQYEGFFHALRKAVAEHDTSTDRVPGQMFVTMPSEAFHTVSAGVGKRPKSPNPQDYIVRTHRGRVDLFLKRSFACDVEGLAVIVYTKEAYLNDPDVMGTPEHRIISESSVSHVIVAVLAFAGPKSPLNPYRFVANLAGGNHEAKTWSADEIRKMAEEIVQYDNTYSVVAD